MRSCSLLHFHLIILTLLLLLVGIESKGKGVFTKRGNVVNPDSCFSQALLSSQSCNNMNIQYTTIMGYSGLGSEFEWLMTALLYAVLHQRRLVYLETPHIPWNYNCPDKRGWACYLAFDYCPDSIVSSLPNSMNETNSILLRKGRKDFAIMNNNNGWIRHAVFQYAWSGQIYNESLAGNFALNEFRLPSNAPKAIYLTEMYSHPIPKNETGLSRYFSEVMKSQTCDNMTLVGAMEVTAVNFLYHLNPQTHAATSALNRELYPKLSGHSHHSARRRLYISLQIRLTDKQSEMSAEKWEWITNVSNVVNTLQPYLSPSSSNHYTEAEIENEFRLSDLFVATDECNVLPELKELLPHHINVHSSCEHLMKNIIQVPSKYGTQRDYLGALKVFADLQMLRGGLHLFGLAESNIVRLARRLQYLSGGYFHAL